MTDIEKYIDDLCTRFGQKISDNLMIPPKYKEVLKPVPNLIKEQAYDTIKQSSTLLNDEFIASVVWSKEYFAYTKKIIEVYDTLSQEDKDIITKYRLSPWQIGLFAKQVGTTPEIITNYKQFIQSKRRNSNE